MGEVGAKSVNQLSRVPPLQAGRNSNALCRSKEMERPLHLAKLNGLSSCGVLLRSRAVLSSILEDATRKNNDTKKHYCHQVCAGTKLIIH